MAEQPSSEVRREVVAELKARGDAALREKCFEEAVRAYSKVSPSAVPGAQQRMQQWRTTN